MLHDPLRVVVVLSTLALAVVLIFSSVARATPLDDLTDVLPIPLPVDIVPSALPPALELPLEETDIPSFTKLPLSGTLPEPEATPVFLPPEATPEPEETPLLDLPIPEPDTSSDLMIQSITDYMDRMIVYHDLQICILLAFAIVCIISNFSKEWIR